MNSKYEKAKKILEKYNQQQLLNCYDKLTDENKEKLLDQILNINFDMIKSLYENTKKEINLKNDKIEAISYIDKSKLTNEQMEKLVKKGEEVIRQGKYAVVTMAGGQGTRLGYTAPKGTFEIGIHTKKSLFEALADNIKEKAEEYNTIVPWYIMTSKENNDATVKFFEKNNYFGFNKNDIKFFKQGQLPMIDTTGKILINEQGLVKEAADGHGGVFLAMETDGVIDDMKKRGIEWIFISGVDNALAKLVDPVATGLAIEKKVLATGKSVVKKGPNEKVGVFCKKNNKPYVIEYSEISEEMANQINKDGELLYGESHILCNLFNIKALENISKHKLPYHSAFKKATYINNDGNIVKPTSPNAYKFEAFLFDAFESLDDMAILRVNREDEFAPLKNAEGTDSPETASVLFENYLSKKKTCRKTYLDKYEEWKNNISFDKKTRGELEKIENDDEEIKDRFYKDLEFGTAGLRGIIGAGTNRMNIYTVGKATQGLANYIKKLNGCNRGVAIAYDSRHMSPEFSEYAALCLNANGIKTYLFDALRPTPELSFAVRELNCIAGIVVTASHNPPEYNGYKVYWEDGAQIVPPIDQDIIDEVKKIKDYGKIKKIDKKDAIEKGLFNIIGKDIDDKYISILKKQVINPELIKKNGKDIKIVYTPLYGTGCVLVKRILKELGYTNLYIVPEQELPDGDFPTVSYPNPEDPKAFDLALKLAKKVDADIVLANDPDADRLGVYAKDSKTGEYKAFTGNMSGLLIAEYMLSEKKKKNMIPKNGILVKTIVSSNMADAIAKYYNINIKEVLTGFKYIGEQIKLYEKNNLYKYLFGFEESYGCLVGTYARDKDGIAAVMMLCEAALYNKINGKTLYDVMIDMYNKYGYYKEGLVSITLKGADGAITIKEMLNKMRKNPPKTIGQYKVLKYRDYKVGKIIDFVTGDITKTDLPESNVLYFELNDDAWCCVRPSGTEPKIKYYVGIKGKNMDDAEVKLKEMIEKIKVNK